MRMTGPMTRSVAPTDCDLDGCIAAVATANERMQLVWIIWRSHVGDKDPLDALPDGGAPVQNMRPVLLGKSPILKRVENEDPYMRRQALRHGHLVKHKQVCNAFLDLLQVTPRLNEKWVLALRHGEVGFAFAAGASENDRLAQVQLR